MKTLGQTLLSKNTMSSKQSINIEELPPRSISVLSEQSEGTLSVNHTILEEPRQPMEPSMLEKFLRAVNSVASGNK